MLKIGPDDDVPLLFGHLEEALEGLRAGVVDEHIEPTQPSRDVVNHRPHFGREADVGRDGNRVHAERLDVGDRLLGAFRFDVVVDGD
jgi:hypothetical protein